MRFLFLALLIVSCVTPYQPNGFAGGYEDQRLGGGRYMVTFYGNGYTHMGTVRSYAIRRANEACEERGAGEALIANIDGNTAASSTGGSIDCTSSGRNTHCAQSPGFTVNKHSVSLVYTCATDSIYQNVSGED